MRLLQRDGPHPNCVELLDVQQGPGPSSDQAQVLLLLTLCQPVTMLDLIKQVGKGWREGNVLEGFLPLVDAVAHLHTRDPPISHRDLKAATEIERDLKLANPAPRV